jgi:hypothetical protein
MSACDEEKKYAQTRKGIHGVNLKKFEEVVADILPSCRPSYTTMPPLIDPDTRAIISSSVQVNPVFKKKIEDESKKFNDLVWPFSILPLDAGCRTGTGKLQGMRAVKKEWQIKSLIQCVLAMLPPSAFGIPDVSNQKKIRIVDFAGGTGHLSLPLAVLLPKCEVVLVDIKGTSLELAHQKAEQLANPSENVEDMHHVSKQIPGGKISPPVDASPFTDVTFHANKLKQSKHIPNLYTFHGSISKYVEEYCEFDIGMGLHACGEASDIVLRACGSANANFIVSPCCVGKLSQTKKDPYIYRATAQNEATISYPQSSTFCQIIENNKSFDVLAKAADYSEMKDMRTSRNATRRTAKALVEMDRLIYMKETYKYDKIALTRMDPWEASVKNDILLGWKKSPENNVGCPYDGDIPQCAACNADIDMAANQLIPLAPSEVKDNLDISSVAACIDWSKEEQDEIQSELDAFMEISEMVYKFKPGMGKRKRKLVHFLARKRNLMSWSEGKKSAEKITVVGKVD